MQTSEWFIIGLLIAIIIAIIWRMRGKKDNHYLFDTYSHNQMKREEEKRKQEEI